MDGHPRNAPHGDHAKSLRTFQNRGRHDGFQTLADDCELLYLHTAAYVPEAEGALNPMDLRLAICWPLEVTELSDRDRSHPNLSADYAGIDL